MAPRAVDAVTRLYAETKRALDLEGIDPPRLPDTRPILAARAWMRLVALIRRR